SCYTCFFLSLLRHHPALPSFPTRRSSDLPEVPLWLSFTAVDRSGRNLSGQTVESFWVSVEQAKPLVVGVNCSLGATEMRPFVERSEEHTSELQSPCNLVCRLLLEKKKTRL